MRSHIFSSQILALNRARYHVQQIARFLMSYPTSPRLHEKLRISTVKVRREKNVSNEITHFQFTNSGTEPGTLSCSADRALSNELSGERVLRYYCNSSLRHHEKIRIRNAQFHNVQHITISFQHPLRTRASLLLQSFKTMARV